MLKSIEFPGGVENCPPGGATDVPKPKSLEMLLMEKNRSLQTENTQMKVANNEVTGERVWGGGYATGVYLFLQLRFTYVYLGIFMTAGLYGQILCANRCKDVAPSGASVTVICNCVYMCIFCVGFVIPRCGKNLQFRERSVVFMSAFWDIPCLLGGFFSFGRSPVFWEVSCLL